ncbi:MAG: ABC transporter substrate-binding protein [Xanthobacteraceae bacterium]
MNTRQLHAALGFAIIAALFLATGANTAAPAPRKIVFLMDWIIGGKHAMFYPAIEKGYYQEEGLDVELRRGTGSDETVQAIDQGNADFGFADAGVLALKVAQGAKVKYLGVVFDNQPLQFLALKQSGIEAPKDFVGKTYGTALASMSGALFPGFLRLNNIDPAKVKMINVEIASTIPALFSQQIDVTAGYSNSGTAIAWATAAKEGRDVVTIPAGQYGLDIYSNGIIVSDRLLDSDPEMVTKFMRATYRGLKYAVEHPSESLDMVFKLHPEIRTKDIATAQFREALKDFLTADAVENGLGHMNASKWQRTRDIIFEAYKVTEGIKAEELYTSKFLPVVKVEHTPKEFLETKVFGKY